MVGGEGGLVTVCKAMLCKIVSQCPVDQFSHGRCPSWTLVASASRGRTPRTRYRPLAVGAQDLATVSVLSTSTSLRPTGRHLFTQVLLSSERSIRGTLKRMCVRAGLSVVEVINVRWSSMAEVATRDFFHATFVKPPTTIFCC